MAIDLQPQRVWLVCTNFVVASKWASVFFTVYLLLRHNLESPPLQAHLTNATTAALSFSFLELFNAFVGLTRSQKLPVLVFNVVRSSVWMLVAPEIGVDAWQTLMTVTCWSFGDAIRFGCFGMDTLVPGCKIFKSVRYTVAPLIFPFGASGEVMMILKFASEGRPLYYLAAALWPFGFYPLMSQLLKQKQKHFAPPNKDKGEKGVAAKIKSV